MTQRELARHIANIKDALGRVDGHLTAFAHIYEQEIGNVKGWKPSLDDALHTARESADALMSAVPNVELVLAAGGVVVDILESNDG